MPIEVATILISSGIQTTVGFLLSKALDKSHDVQDQSISFLEVLRLFEKQFSSQVDQIIKMQLVEDQLSELKTKLLVTHDLLKDYASSKQLSYLQDAEKQAREAWAASMVFSERVTAVEAHNLETCSIAANINMDSSPGAQRARAIQKLRLSTIHLLKGIAAIELTILFALKDQASDPKPFEMKIKERAAIYHDRMAVLITPFLRFALMTRSYDASKEALGREMYELYMELNNLSQGTCHEEIRDVIADRACEEERLKQAFSKNRIFLPIPATPPYVGPVTFSLF